MIIIIIYKYVSLADAYSALRSLATAIDALQMHIHTKDGGYYRLVFSI